MPFKSEGKFISHVIALFFAKQGLIANILSAKFFEIKTFY